MVFNPIRALPVFQIVYFEYIEDPDQLCCEAISVIKLQYWTGWKSEALSMGLQDKVVLIDLYIEQV